MPKARKRKVPLTRVETASSSSSTPHSSRTVIRRFHVLIKQRTQLQNATIRDAANAKALAYIDQQIADLGGLETYQRMSAIGQGNDRGGGSHKVLIDWLKEKRMSEGREGKLRYVQDRPVPISWSQVPSVGCLKSEHLNLTTINRVCRGSTQHRWICAHDTPTS